MKDTSSAEQPDLWANQWELVKNFQFVGCVLEAVLDGARQFWGCRHGFLLYSIEPFKLHITTGTCALGR